MQDTIEERMFRGKVIIVIGARQVGKSTLFNMVLEGRKEPRAAEVKEALWLPFDEALSAIRYQPDRDILLQAAAYVKAKENRS